MDTNAHTYETLFEQLGLDSDSEAIDRFIAEHKPLPPKVELHEAEFWNRSQATFLRQTREEDADWAPIVDKLNTALR